jgi:hypothetical protein
VNSLEAQLAATVFHFLAASHHVEPQAEPWAFTGRSADAVFSRPDAAAPLLHHY